jgi:hypothetical protein
MSPTAWLNKDAGNACDDKLYCNGTDSCDGRGRCETHAGDPCAGSDTCRLCSESSKSCVYATDKTLYDVTSNLTWEVKQGVGVFDWQPAIDRCASLTFCGQSDWRLPTITELRSLIRGCASTQTGGSCPVTDSCLTNSCNDGCFCSNGMTGPGSDGAFWPPGLEGNAGYAWSASTVTDEMSRAWIVFFLSGSIGPLPKLSTSQADAATVRCTRTGR